MLQLPVERLPSAESGRNLAFLDPQLLAPAGVKEGSVVELKTQRGRRLLARVAARPQDEGRGCLRLDRFQIQFLKPDLREKILLNPVQIEEAKRLVLEPMAPLTGNLTALERELQDYLHAAANAASPAAVISPRRRSTETRRVLTALQMLVGRRGENRIT